MCGDSSQRLEKPLSPPQHDYGVGMLARLAFLWSRPSLFRGKRLKLYIDNNAVVAIIRGGCANPFIAATVCVFWKRVDSSSFDVWIGRVGSEMNPVDLPTMRPRLPFGPTGSVQFPNLYKLLRETIIFMRIRIPHLCFPTYGRCLTDRISSGLLTDFRPFLGRILAHSFYEVTIVRVPHPLFIY